MDKNKQAVGLFDRLADLYREKYMDVGMYAASLDIFIKSVKQDPEILELACGPGNITKYLLEKRPDFYILATDLAPNMVAHAKSVNPLAETMLLDCRETRKLKQQFDAVVAAFCLPYLSREETEKLLRDIYGILHPGGAFYLSTIDGNYSESRYVKGSTGDEIFQYYYSEEFLNQTLTNLGFSILDSRKTVTGTDVDIAIVCIKDK